MSWAPIGWNQFSWEAFATLTAGLAAVGAAAYVGYGQIRLLRRQTELNEAAEQRAEKLFSLDAKSRIQSSRLALLDRRLVLIERFRSIFTVWTQGGKLLRTDFDELRSIAQQTALIYDDTSASFMFECFIVLQNAQRDHLRADIFGNLGDVTKSTMYRDRAWKTEDSVVELIPKIMDQLQDSAKILNISSDELS